MHSAVVLLRDTNADLRDSGPFVIRDCTCFLTQLSGTPDVAASLVLNRWYNLTITNFMTLTHRRRSSAPKHIPEPMETVVSEKCASQALHKVGYFWSLEDIRITKPLYHNHFDIYSGCMWVPTYLSYIFICTYMPRVGRHVNGHVWGILIFLHTVTYTNIHIQCQFSLHMFSHWALVRFRISLAAYILALLQSSHPPCWGPSSRSAPCWRWVLERLRGSWCFHTFLFSFGSLNRQSGLYQVDLTIRNARRRKLR